MAEPQPAEVAKTSLLDIAAIGEGARVQIVDGASEEHWFAPRCFFVSLPPTQAEEPRSAP